MNRDIVSLDLTKTRRGDNDRVEFSEAKDKELALQIQQDGLLQPITVRPLADGFYEIVAGERRFRAVKSLGWAAIPAQIIRLSDEQAATFMLAENMSRAELNPIEEAEAYAKRIQRFGWSVEDCAIKAGVSSVRVQFRLKLLRLITDIRFLVKTGSLPIGYAQILADANLNPAFQMLAVTKYRDSSNPTPPWFRLVVGDLLEKQSQVDMFDAPLFTGYNTETKQNPPAVDLPADPRFDKFPVSGVTPKAKLQSQIAFWERAAQGWQAIGKTFKHQECQAVVAVLRSTAESM